MTSTGCSPCKGRVRAFCAGVGVVACLGLATQVVAAGEPAPPPAARSAVVQTRLLCHVAYQPTGPAGTGRSR